MINGKDLVSVVVLLLWFGVGCIVVLVGFLGVGKFILINMLLGEEWMKIVDVCVNDLCGCYIIIYCVFILLLVGVCLIDIFGMCEFKLIGEEVFSESGFVDVEVLVV